MTDEEIKRCSNCKHIQMRSGFAHQQWCGKFAETPCVAARGSEDKCGNKGKDWEPQE